MNGEELKLKYYDVFIIGHPLCDAQGVPTKDPVTGELIPEWVRTGNPAPEVVAAIGRGRFFQTEFVESVEGDAFRNLRGINVELGPMTTRGKTVNIFESRYREIFKAFNEKILAGRIKVIVPLTTRQIAGGKSLTTCTGKITDYAIPGYHLVRPAGFVHYMYQRNPSSHVLEKRLTPGWDDKGKWDMNKCTVINWCDVFLFANELQNAEAIFKTELAIAKKFEFVSPVDTSHVSSPAG